MKLESFITSGRCVRPTGQFWYGLEGTRKTGTAVSPQTLDLDLERGSDQYDMDRIHIETYADLIKALDLIIQEKSRHEIIVVDPIEIAEKLLIGETCRRLKIDGLQGLAHGAAWQYLRENFDREYMARFDEIRRRGRHVIVIGHAIIRTVTLPGLAESFDRYEPRIDARNAATLVEWADHVLFFDWNVRTAKTRDGVVRALVNNEPIVHVVHSPSWTAKNRVGLTEPLKPEFTALAPLFGITTERPGVELGDGAQPADSSNASARAPSPLSRPPAVETPPNPDTAATEPFLSDEEIRTIEAFLAGLPQERLLTFLRGRNLIKADDDYHALGPHFIRRILSDPVGFKEAVEGD